MVVNWRPSLLSRHIMTRSCPRTALSDFLSYFLLAAQNLANANLISSSPGNPFITNAANLTNILDPHVMNVSTPGSGGLLDIKCSGSHFGYSPSISDCESARRYITPDSEQYTWGQRHTGLEATVFPLPFRTMGGGCSQQIGENTTAYVSSHQTEGYASSKQSSWALVQSLREQA